MDNMKVNNKRLQKLILDTQKSVGQLSKLAYETGVQDGLIKANALNALNPLDNTSMRWIPCSERLPEEDGSYLVTLENGHEKILNYATTQTIRYPQGFYYITEDGFAWRQTQNLVTAWMPLPEPYEERKEQCE